MRNTCSLYQFRDDLWSIWRKWGFLKDEIFINYNIQDCKGLKLSFEKQVCVSHPHVACSRLFSQTLCYSPGHLPGPQVSNHTLPLVAIGWCYSVIPAPKREPFTIKPLFAPREPAEIGPISANYLTCFTSSDFSESQWSRSHPKPPAMLVLPPQLFIIEWNRCWW